MDPGAVDAVVEEPVIEDGAAVADSASFPESSTGGNNDGVTNNNEHSDTDISNKVKEDTLIKKDDTNVPDQTNEKSTNDPIEANNTELQERVENTDTVSNEPILEANEVENPMKEKGKEDDDDNNDGNDEMDVDQSEALPIVNSIVMDDPNDKDFEMKDIDDDDSKSENDNDNQNDNGTNSGNSQDNNKDNDENHQNDDKLEQKDEKKDEEKVEGKEENGEEDDDDKSLKSTAIRTSDQQNEKKSDLDSMKSPVEDINEVIIKNEDKTETEQMDEDIDDNEEDDEEDDADDDDDDNNQDNIVIDGKSSLSNKNGTQIISSSIEIPDIHRQTHTIVLPSYSSWFDLTKVHQIERESLPEFFENANKNKTLEIYIKYRNFMVNSYRLNPNDYLSFTAVRRNLIGDAGTLLRVHKFLNKWGLINYQVNPETKPVLVEPPYTGDFTVDLDTPRGMFPFQSYKPPTNLPDLTKFKNILSNNNITIDNQNKEKIDLKPKIENNSEDLKDKETHDEVENKDENVKVNTLDSESNNYKSIDIEQPPLKKQKIVRPDINSNWTEESLQKLVEGVSKFKNDWYKIAQFVDNGKTPDACIIRFLQLPIEDKFLENNKELLGPLKYVPNLTFSPNDNPIMSTLSFLANLVDSDVAVAASNRAIKLTNKKLEKKLNRYKDLPVSGEENIESEDPLKDIKDAAINSFGIIGARSHLFATYEEREMHKSLTNIIQHELKIVDMKLAKLTALEKEFELQKKLLEKKSNELVQEKLSIFKYNNSATSKLLQIISILESSDDYKDVDVEKIKDLISQANDILHKPPRKQLNILEEGCDNNNSNNDTEINESVKPISFEAPMLYRYWSG